VRGALGNGSPRRPIFIYNLGLPILFVTLPGMLLALLPIIALETAVFEHRLRIGYFRVAGRVAMANAVSTIIGVPIACVLYILIPFPLRTLGEVDVKTIGDHILFVLSHGGWLFPNDCAALGFPVDDCGWLVPAAATASLIPALLLSVLIEGTIMARMEPLRLDKRTTWGLVWRANVFSYLVLLCVSGAWLFAAITTTVRFEVSVDPASPSPSRPGIVRVHASVSGTHDLASFTADPLCGKAHASSTSDISFDWDASQCPFSGRRSSPGGFCNHELIVFKATTRGGDATKSFFFYYLVCSGRNVVA